MNWDREQLSKAIETLGRSTSFTEAIAEIRQWRPGLTKAALRMALDHHGMRAPTAYLGADVDDAAEPMPPTARSARGDVHVPTTPTKESELAPARSERWREPEQADRSFVAPPSDVRAFGKPGQTWLFLPDTHVPYHDARAWQLALAVAAELKPDGVCILGDFLDCYSVSFHSKSAGRVSKLADEIDDTRKCLDDLEAVTPNAERVFVEGNHEHRLTRYIAGQASALSGLAGLTFREALRLEWAWIPYHEHCTIGDTAVTHEAGRAGIYAVRQTMLHMGRSLIIGHIHRVNSVVECTLDGRQLAGHSFGWLGDANAIDYRHRALAAREWQHGVGVGTIDACGVLHAHAVPFIGGRAIVNGKEIRA
jgi:predicted phosphodiesterase